MESSPQASSAARASDREPDGGGEGRPPEGLQALEHRQEPVLPLRHPGAGGEEDEVAGQAVQVGDGRQLDRVQHEAHKHEAGGADAEPQQRQGQDGAQEQHEQIPYRDGRALSGGPKQVA